jgi:hypothetical protein
MNFGGEIMINPQAPTARKNGLVVQEMPDEVLVYDLETDKAHCLNQTAAFVWKNCDGKTSVNEIVAQFEKQQGSKINEDLVWLAIDQLSERKLLENSVATKFAGESRRSVLKKIGFASVVALPVIASLVARRLVPIAEALVSQDSSADAPASDRRVPVRAVERRRRAIKRLNV